jgi:hypothetical protein
MSGKNINGQEEENQDKDCLFHARVPQLPHTRGWEKFAFEIGFL